MHPKHGVKNCLVLLLWGVSVYVAIVCMAGRQVPLADRLQLLIVAIAFALVGMGSIRGLKNKAATRVGGLICLGLSALGFFTAFGSGSLSGGIPLIPEAWNQILGRTMFGIGGCISATMGFYFLRQSHNRSLKK